MKKTIEMNHVSFMKRVLGVVAIGLMGAFYSCSDNTKDSVTAQDANAVASESISDAYFQDADDMTRVSAETTFPSSGRTAAADDRLACAVITVTAGATTSSGQITIDFGAGCTDLKGNVRKGKIIVNYSNGPAGQVGFQTVTTFNAYSINGVALEGSRTVTRIAPVVAGNIRHTIALVNGKATWSDGTFASRTANFVREINPVTGVVTLEGSANGINREWKDYTVNITKALVYKKDCAVSAGVYMAVEGTKTITSGGRSVSIDFGTGACDKIVTVTINGFSKEVTVGA